MRQKILNILKEENFAIIKANWENKVENIINKFTAIIKSDKISKTFFEYLPLTIRLKPTHSCAVQSW